MSIDVTFNLFAVACGAAAGVLTFLAHQALVLMMNMRRRHD